MVTNKGQAYMWGRGEYFKPKFDDIKKFSRPIKICCQWWMKYVSVGVTHCMLVEEIGSLWCLGEN